jgi:hypothetical protein
LLVRDRDTRLSEAKGRSLASAIALAIFNWAEAPRERVPAPDQLGLDPAAAHFASEFWDAERWRLPAGQPQSLKAIPSHGARLLAIRRRRLAVPLLVGSTFHCSQGGQVAGWTVTDRQLRAQTKLDRMAEGEWWLAVPARPRAATPDDQSLSPAEAGDSIYRLTFTVDRAQTLSICW